jgi:hypothetical protein
MAALQIIPSPERAAEDRLDAKLFDNDMTPNFWRATL